MYTDLGQESCIRLIMYNQNYLFVFFYRCHIVSQFNDGLYDYIIASDESMLMNPKDTPQDKQKHRK